MLYFLCYLSLFTNALSEEQLYDRYLEPRYKTTLRIYFYLTKLFDELQLHYWLENGALLALIRDRRIIFDWDDDVDFGGIYADLIKVYPRLRERLLADGHNVALGNLGQTKYLKAKNKTGPRIMKIFWDPLTEFDMDTERSCWGIAGPPHADFFILDQGETLSGQWHLPGIIVPRTSYGYASNLLNHSDVLPTRRICQTMYFTAEGEFVRFAAPNPFAGTDTRFQHVYTDYDDVFPIQVSSHNFTYQHQWNHTDRSHLKREAQEKWKPHKHVFDSRYVEAEGLDPDLGDHSHHHHEANFLSPQSTATARPNSTASSTASTGTPRSTTPTTAPTTTTTATTATTHPHTTASPPRAYKTRNGSDVIYHWEGGSQYVVLRLCVRLPNSPKRIARIRWGNHWRIPSPPEPGTIWKKGHCKLLSPKQLEKKKKKAEEEDDLHD